MGMELGSWEKKTPGTAHVEVESIRGTWKVYQVSMRAQQEEKKKSTQFPEYLQQKKLFILGAKDKRMTELSQGQDWPGGSVKDKR